MDLKLPFYIKFTFIALGIISFCTIMYIGQGIILPLVYAGLISILLNPVVNYLVAKKWNKIIAIGVTVTLAVLLTLALLYFVTVQLSLFSETYPLLKIKFVKIGEQIVKWISGNFNIKEVKIYAWINQTRNEAISNMGDAIGQTIATVNNILVIVVLFPVYLFMILFYKNILLEFIWRLFPTTQHETVLKILINGKKIIQSYLMGLLLEAVIIAVLNSMGLLILGIDYAIILGVTGALLNVIPYIGGVIAIALPMLMAFVTKDSTSSVFLVMGIYLLIQFVDNNIIVPQIVASKVKINALVSVVVVLIGGAFWGVSGMFLSIPLTAILKVVFDQIEPLKPWGFLLGNIVPTTALRLDFPKKRK